MIEFLFTADIHLTEYRNDRYVNYNDKKLPKKTVAIIECLYELGEYARKNTQSKTIVLGGDLVDKQSVEYASTIEIWEEYFEIFNDLNFVIITGNHDISDKSETPFNWLRRFEKFNNIHLIDYGKYEKWNNRILLLSYKQDIIQHIREAVENYPECDILISHFGVHEARISKSIKGFGKVRFSDLSQKFKLILLGDYHIPQELTLFGSKLIYSGSVIQKDWNEIDQEKRFLHVKINNDEIDISSIKYTKYPKHIKLIINGIEEIEKIKEEYNALKKDNYVNIVYNIDKKISTRQKNKILEEIRKHKLSENIVVLENVKEEKEVESIDLTMDNKDKLIEFLKIKGIENIKEYLEPIKEFV